LRGCVPVTCQSVQAFRVCNHGRQFPQSSAVWSRDRQIGATILATGGLIMVRQVGGSWAVAGAACLATLADGEGYRR
jgi:hypothetical protein